MAASKSFIRGIQGHLGEGYTEEEAAEACEWLDNVSPIDPMLFDTGVPDYLRYLGTELPDCPSCDELQAARDNANALWSKMFKEVFGIDV